MSSVVWVEVEQCSVHDGVGVVLGGLFRFERRGLWRVVLEPFGECLVDDFGEADSMLFAVGFGAVE